MGAIFGAIGMKLVEVMLPTLATAAAGLLVALLAKQLKKVGLDLTDQQAAQLKVLVADAIRATEEAARRHPNLTGTQKADITAQAIAQARPDLDLATIRKLVDATLPVVRAADAAAPVKVRVPVPSTPATIGR